MRIAIILLAVLVGCSDQPRRDDGCDKEYAGTVMHCAPQKKSRNPRDLVEVCERRGPGPGDCYYVDRGDLERILRGM